MSIARESRFLAIVAMLSALCACGGGGSSSAPSVSAPTPTASPISQASSSATLTPGGTAQTASFGSVGAGYTGSITIPSVTSGSGSLTATLLSALPASAPTVASTARMIAAIGGTLTPLVYVTLVPTAAITLSATPTFTFALPAGSSFSAGSSLYVGFYDPAQSATGWQVLLGPGSVSGQTITFAAINRTIIFAAGTTYTFALFSTGQVLTPVAPSPSPSPSGTVAPADVHLVNAALRNANPNSLSLRRVKATSPSPSPSASANDLFSVLPTVVESSGSNAGTYNQWAGNIVVWVTDSLSGQDVAETSATASGTNGLGVNNPSIEPYGCTPGSSDQWCVAHPTAWVYGTSGGGTKPVGKQIITVTFGDGATVQIPNPVYDGYNLPCNQGWSYQGGLPTFAAFASADIYFDCANSAIDFPHGAVLAATPKTYPPINAMAPQFLTILSAVPLGASPPTQFPFSGIQDGSIYVMATGDGAFAKVYIDNFNIAGSPPTLGGFALHSQADGSYAF